MSRPPVSLPVPAPAPEDPPDEVDPADQAVIDQALQVVYADHHRFATRLCSPSALRPLDPEHLRRGPLGRDLARLALVARGRAGEPPEGVLAAIDAVVQLLFWPAAAEDYQVPRAFWETELGRLLALAKFRAFAPTELVGIGAAAHQLGVTRPTIYRWIDDRSLDSVRDQASGRTFVVRRGVDALSRVALELAPPA
jgi:excisionase family DNA binding protein